MSGRRGARRGAPPTGDELELVWAGKYDAQGRRVQVPPRALALAPCEQHGPDAAPTGELVWGDNLDALDAWLPRYRGRVDLVYIDPPFSTGSQFSVLTRARAADGRTRVLAQPAYTDRWPGGSAAYLAMLAPRLARLHELLAPHGSIYVHVDPTLGHAVRLVLDEVFGAASFQREIVWRIGWVSGFKTRARNWIRNHDTILFYAKDPTKLRFHKAYVPHPPGYARRAGASAQAPGMAIDDVWNAGSGDLALVGRDALDSIQIKSFSREKTGYATQKNESLLRRIVEASSSPGDMVLDAFCGAGTTAVVAASLGRRFLACDVGRAAIQLTRARLRRMVPKASWTLAVPVPPGPRPRRAARAVKVVRRGAGRWRVELPAGRRVHGGTDAGDVHPQLVLDVALDRRGHLQLHIDALTIDAAPGPDGDRGVDEALRAGVCPLLECAVDWSAHDATLRPSVFDVATAEAPVSRTYVAPQPLVAPARVLVQLVDVRFVRTRIELAFTRARGWSLRANLL